MATNAERAGRKTGELLNRAGERTLSPLVQGAKIGLAAARGTGQFAKGLAGIGSATPASEVNISDTPQPVLAPTLQAPQRTPFASGASSTLTGTETPRFTPQRRVGPVATGAPEEVASAPMPLTSAAERPLAGQDVLPRMSDGQGQDIIAPESVALRGQPERGQPALSSMAMTSPAAAAMARRFAVSAGVQGERAQAGGARNLRLMGDAELAQKRAQWEEAGQRAFESAMSPAQLARYRSDQRAAAVEQAKLYRESPQAQEAEAARRTALQIARTTGERKLMESLLPAQMTAAAQRERTQAERDVGLAGVEAEKAKAATTATERRDLAAETRKAQELSAIGSQIVDLSKALNQASELDPESKTAKMLESRITQMMKKQNELLGITDETAQPAQAVTPVARGAQVLGARSGGTPVSAPANFVFIRAPSGATQRVTAERAQKYLSRPGYTRVG